MMGLGFMGVGKIGDWRVEIGDERLRLEIRE